MENKTIRLFTIADDKKEYNRYKSLLDGSLKSVLDNKKISQALRDNSAEIMSKHKQITLIHDPCDIRKEYSKKLENIGKVLDLNKQIINGYYTFNTVAVDNKQSRIKFFFQKNFILDYTWLTQKFTVTGKLNLLVKKKLNFIIKVV